MNITAKTFQPYHKTSDTKSGIEKSPAYNLSNNKNDTFEYNQTPAFGSVNVQMATLRKYAKDLGCAYTEKEIISAETYNYIMRKVKIAKSDSWLMEKIYKYSKLMDNFERKIFNFYRTNLNSSSNKTIESITQKQFPKSASKLLPRYIQMVENLEVFAKELPDTKLSKRINATIEAWKQDLLNGDYENAMVSNKYQTIIEKMHFPKDKKQIRAKFVNEFSLLPAPSNDFDAFIVKHKNSNKRTILKQLIFPFTVSIEHIKAKGKGGHANDIGNCMLVRTKDNHARGTDDIMINHPERKKTIISYFRRVVDKINNGGMRELLFYPFELKKTLETETHNMINLEKEVARLNITEEEAYRTFII